jgi:hypothetical protein
MACEAVLLNSSGRQRRDVLMTPGRPTSSRKTLPIQLRRDCAQRVPRGAQFTQEQQHLRLCWVRLEGAPVDAERKPVGRIARSPRSRFARRAAFVR